MYIIYWVNRANMDKEKKIYTVWRNPLANPTVKDVYHSN
jgi:hypothetical protein